MLQGRRVSRAQLCHDVWQRRVQRGKEVRMCRYQPRCLGLILDDVPCSGMDDGYAGAALLGADCLGLSGPGPTHYDL